MFRNILIGVLTVGVIAISIFAYNVNKEKNNVLVHAENNYQRAFHELTYHMDVLHDNIGTSLAMNSKEKLSPQFVDIWRVTSEAMGNVSQLPLDIVPVHETEKFLHSIGNFTYKTSIRNLDDEPLNKEELATLRELYEQSAQIKDDLRQMQYVALNDGIKWMDVDLLLSTGAKEENAIIDGFKSVEDNVTKYSEQENPLLMTDNDQTNKYSIIKGEKQSEEEIKRKARDLFQIEAEEDLALTKSEKGADIQTYSLSHQDDDRYMYVEMTEKGAYPLSLLIDRPISETSLSLYDGQLEAEEFLKSFDFKNMELYETQQFDQMGLYAFVPVEDDVRIFPDTIAVKVALDNGDIIGLQTYEYVRNHHDRKLEKPKVTMEEAKEQVNGNIQIEEANIALIENMEGEEVIAYEFVGTMDEETYRIFINGETGMEEKVEKLSNKEMNFEAVI